VVLAEVYELEAPLNARDREDLVTMAEVMPCLDLLG